jgi:hypothetical protein
MPTPDAAQVVRHQLSSAQQQITIARKDPNIPNSVGSALLHLEAAIKNLAIYSGIEIPQSGGSGGIPVRVR